MVYFGRKTGILFGMKLGYIKTRSHQPCSPYVSLMTRGNERRAIVTRKEGFLNKAPDRNPFDNGEPQRGIQLMGTRRHFCKGAGPRKGPHKEEKDPHMEKK